MGLLLNNNEWRGRVYRCSETRSVHEPASTETSSDDSNANNRPATPSTVLTPISFCTHYSVKKKDRTMNNKIIVWGVIHDKMVYKAMARKPVLF